ncbi:helix-turn-helix transcriptional regulator [Flagellimonas sp. 389]|uniref:helix-turn-helix domain-containing protein n=1 Tax=Flagellimonas sp. 389 TaxID=2835862 RepID=UPI001BD44210|nr:helix-turn-helix transcriptional regulator [Flagellimonas sp. 389]MBS9463037.1 helix-turn-helix transcriptional regulator [Flagellimonas sp. 389]
MPSFTFVDIILFLGVSQGLFLSLSLRLIHHRNISANRILSLLLLIAATMLFCRITAFRISEDWIWRFGILIDTTIFLFGPLLYLYIKRLLFRSVPPFRLNWFHYVPALLHFCYYLWTLTIPLSDFNNRYFSGGLNIMFFLVEATGLLALTFYWLKAFLLVKNYPKEEEKELSYHQNIIQFLRFFLFALLIFVLLWSISFISASFLGIIFTYLNYVTMWISIPIFVYIVGYFSLRQPEIFRIPVPAKEKSEKQRLKPDEIQKLQKRLHYFISEEKVFLRPDLTLKGLAEKMNTTRNNLSWLLNQTYQISFYDYINRFRIEEFLIKINREEHLSHTLLALAMDVGFNSKSTFNKAFKNEVGQTPSEYIKKNKVA